MMKGVSIVICCYNSSGKLPVTLQHLARQVAVAGAGYELLLVDNNCTDDTVAGALKTWSDLQEPFPLRIVKETKPGLNFARIAGVQNANAGYVVFCDDDNWLCEDYLYRVYHHFENKKELALIGGVGVAECETPPPAWFETLQGFGYAVGDEGRQTGFVASVYGAGMALRRPVFLEVTARHALLLSDRSGRQLSSGGDAEICQLVRGAGYAIYLDRSLTFRHFLTRNRLTWPYYLRLRKSFGVAGANLGMLAMGDGTKAREKTGIRQFFSLVNYCVRHWPYALFPLLIKTARCADFVQQKSMRLALLRAKNK